MAIATDAVLKAVVSMALPNSVVAQNVFWCTFDNDGTSADEEDVTDDLETWLEGVYANLLAQLSTGWSLTQLDAYVRDAVEDDFDEIGTSFLTGVGTDASQLLPHGAAALTRIQTVNPDVQGKKFWAGMTEGQNGTGNLTAAVITALGLANADWATAFTGAQTGSGFTPGVWSIAKTAFFAFANEQIINTFWGYQRRRKPGVGI